MAATTRQYVPMPQQRIAAIEDVVYEFANLMAAAHFSMRGQAPWRTNCDDAFLLGCRKIGHFLMAGRRSTKNGQELDDVLALDYLPTDQTRGWSLPIWTAEWRDPMDKQLAHITYSRDKEWDHRTWVPKLELEFRNAWWSFCQAIVDDGYKREFDRQITVCQAKPGFGNIILQRR
jgi:hypothetical protein